MNKLKVALVSFLFKDDVEQNLLSIISAVENTSREGCELVCFPECALTGLPSDDYNYDIAKATEIPGKITDKIGELAKAYSIFIAIGLLECEGKSMYDTAVLFDNEGSIILKYRRINLQWRAHNAPEGLYVEGTSLNTSVTPFGKIAFAICGDMFDDKVVNVIKEARPDYLIIPLMRSFEDNSHNVKRWEHKEKSAYTQQIAKIGITSFLVNAFMQKGSFGGLLIISGNGEVIAETQIGQPSVLVYKLPRAV